MDTQAAGRWYEQRFGESAVLSRLAEGAGFGAGFLDACLAVALSLVPPAIVAGLVIRRTLAVRRDRTAG